MKNKLVYYIQRKNCVSGVDMLYAPTIENLKRVRKLTHVPFSLFYQFKNGRYIVSLRYATYFRVSFIF